MMILSAQGLDRQQSGGLRNLSKDVHVHDGTTKTVLLIIGMRDNSCRECVTGVLERIEGVMDVNVSLLRARAMVMHEPSCGGAELIRELEKAGYGATLASGNGEDACADLGRDPGGSV
jgi:copper chaperone CopZ